MTRLPKVEMLAEWGHTLESRLFCTTLWYYFTSGPASHQTLSTRVTAPPCEHSTRVRDPDRTTLQALNLNEPSRKKVMLSCWLSLHWPTLGLRIELKFWGSVQTGCEICRRGSGNPTRLVPSANWVNDSSLGLDDSWTQATFTFARASTAPHEERWVNLGGRCPGRDRRYLGIQVVLIACPTVSPHGSSSWKDIT